MKKRIIAVFLICLLILSGCGTTSGSEAQNTDAAVSDETAVSGEAAASDTAAAQTPDASEDEETLITVSGDGYPLTVTDALGYETTIETAPQKVAVLSGTPMNIWYDLGGKSICTSDVSANIRLTEGYEEEICALPTVGQVYALNTEAVVEQRPDLIIAQLGTQNTVAASLRDMGFDVIITHIRSLKDVMDTYRAFGKILEQNELAEQRISELAAGRDAVVEQLPDTQPSVVILYVTSKSLAVKLDNSIAGDIAAILELDNIASNLPPDTIGSETTPLDIEYIVEQDPDYVLVTTMISSNEEARATVEEQFASNPAWSSVEAISEGRVIYLPQQYFLYNAGPYYVDAITYMAKGIYPEIYGELTGELG